MANLSQAHEPFSETYAYFCAILSPSWPIATHTNTTDLSIPAYQRLSVSSHLLQYVHPDYCANTFLVNSSSTLSASIHHVSEHCRIRPFALPSPESFKYPFRPNKMLQYLDTIHCCGGRGRRCTLSRQEATQSRRKPEASPGSRQANVDLCSQAEKIRDQIKKKKALVLYSKSCIAS
jgi:hypothetical protein